MFRFSTNMCYSEWFQSIEQILNVLFNYKPKRYVGLLRHLRMTYFHLECQNLIKNQIMSFFFALVSIIFFSKPLECKFAILKKKDYPY